MNWAARKEKALGPVRDLEMTGEDLSTSSAETLEVISSN